MKREKSHTHPRAALTRGCTRPRGRGAKRDALERPPPGEGVRGRKPGDADGRPPGVRTSPAGRGPQTRPGARCDARGAACVPLPGGSGRTAAASSGDGAPEDSPAPGCPLRRLRPRGAALRGPAAWPGLCRAAALRPRHHVHTESPSSLPAEPCLKASRPSPSVQQSGWRPHGGGHSGTAGPGASTG